MDNLFNSQTVPVTKADIENAGLDSTNCINAQHIRDNSITTQQKNSLYEQLPTDKPDTNGCYISTQPGADEVDTSIKVIGTNGVKEGYILHTSDIAHLKTTPFNKLLKNMMNSLLLTIVIAIIICASSFWLNYSNCITVNTDGECNDYLGENKDESAAKLIDYLFPSNLWNWPYNECENKQAGGSINYDEKNIRVNERSDNECNATDLDEGKKNNNVFPYSFLRNLEEDYKDYHILKVIPKYSLTLVLCIMLVYRKIVKLIIKKGISLNNSLKDNPIGKILIIVLSILFFTTMLGLINNFIIPVVSLLLLAVILFKHLYDLGSIIGASIEGNKKTFTKRFSTAVVGAIITVILMLIFHLGDIKEGDMGLGFYALAFVLYCGLTYNGYLVSGTFAIILFAIAAVVSTNIMRADAAKEANEFYTPIFTNHPDFFKYNSINMYNVNFVKAATSLPRNHRDNFVYMNSKVEKKYQALDFSITKNKPPSTERYDAYIYTDNNGTPLNDSSMVELFDTIRTTYVIDAKERGVSISWLKNK